MRNFIFLFILCAAVLSTQAQTKKVEHGIIAGGGMGHLKTNTQTPAIGNANLKNGNNRYKYNFLLGYRFRFHPQAGKFFFDVDAGLSVRAWHSENGISPVEPPLHEISSAYYSVFAGGTINLTLYKGLSIGMGLEPTAYFYQDGEKSSRKFDVPLTTRIAYRFKPFEVGLTYKCGLTNMLKTDYLKSGKFRDINLSVWVPF